MTTKEETFSNKVDKFAKNMAVLKAKQEGRQEALKEVFDKFDKYACIKDDEWYLEFKERMLKEQTK
jgi:hypothetical protein